MKCPKCKVKTFALTRHEFYGDKFVSRKYINECPKCNYSIITKVEE